MASADVTSKLRHVSQECGESFKEGRSYSPGDSSTFSWITLPLSTIMANLVQVSGSHTHWKGRRQMRGKRSRPLAARAEAGSTEVDVHAKVL